MEWPATAGFFRLTDWAAGRAIWPDRRASGAEAPIETSVFNASILNWMTGDSVSRFYDEFASHYHLIFDNWDRLHVQRCAEIVTPTAHGEHRARRRRLANVLERIDYDGRRVIYAVSSAGPASHHG
jgi:hypothetical protein